MGQLDSRVAIITGGGSGIGKAMARAFLAEGCSVVIAARDDKRLQRTAQELDREGTRIAPIATDVTDEDSVVALFRKTMERFGRLDILVNNAGAFDGGRVDQVTLEAWNRVLMTNVTGAFLCTREAFRIMIPAGGGRIVNIGSTAGQRPREHSAPYTASKHAIWGLTQASALDGREYGIAVSCLHPGNTLVERRGIGPSQSGKDDGDEAMIAAEDIARTALLMVTLPPQANMLEAIVLPVGMKYIGRG